MSELHGNIVSRGVVEAGRITFDHEVVAVEPRGNHGPDFILPGFIDLQVNGGDGIDVMSATAEDLLQLSRSLANQGTTGWLPTVITAPLDTVERVDRIIAEAISIQQALDREGAEAGRPLAGATILGMHLEGPFIAPTRLGVHPPHNLLPQGAALDRIARLKTLRLITLAPELDGALSAIRLFVTRNIAVSIGHTDATFDQAMAAVEAGARMFTHVFNAMPPMHHRAPGAAGAALSASRARAALIPDGIHVHPAILRLAAKARPSHLLLTTDRVAIAGSGAALGPLFGGTVARAHVEDGAARLEDGTLAGSVITMVDGARMMMELEALGWAGIQLSAAYGPASVLRMHNRGVIAEQARADLIVLDRELKLKAVFVGGRELN